MPFIKRPDHICDVPLPANDHPDAEWYCPKCFKVWQNWFFRPGIDVTYSHPRKLESFWRWQWTGKKYEQSDEG